jgi:membrane-associated phospholipid phosphatase
MLSYLLMSVIRGAAARTLIITVAAALVLSITVSRLFLGQHYLSDASAGLAAGLVWLASCVSGIQIALQRKS